MCCGLFRRLKARMRIMHLSEPGSGGVKRYVVDLLNGLSSHRLHSYSFGYSLKRIDGSYLGDIAQLKEQGISCQELTIVPALNPWHDCLSALRLAWILHRDKPDILHMHSSKAGGIGRLVSKLCFPSVFTIYVPHAMACYRSRVFLWLERLLAPLSDFLVAVSPSEGDDFNRWRVNCGRNVRVVRIGLKSVPTAPAKHLRSEFIVAAGGRICAQKNALLFFQVAVRLVKANPHWRFVWVGSLGDDAEARAVEALLHAAASPQITITGWVETPEHYLGAADVFCMFSRYESFGYITAEAMLSGVPVLAADCTGTRDLVRHGETGIMVEAAVDAICDALEACWVDRTNLAATAKRAREFIIGRHSLVAMTADVSGLYEEVDLIRRTPVI